MKLKNLFKMILNFVIPGFYKEKLSSDEHAVVVKIISESEERPGYFVSDDGKLYNEDNLLSNYDYLGNSMNPKYAKELELKRKKLFRDIEDLKDTNIEDVFEKFETEEKQENKVEESNPTLEIRQLQNPPSITRPLEIEDMIVERHINNSNSSLIINFEIEKILSFSDLNLISKTMNLDKDKLSDAVYRKLVNSQEFADAFKSMIRQKIENPDSEKIVIKKETPEEPKKEFIYEEVIHAIDKKISEIAENVNFIKEKFINTQISDINESEASIKKKVVKDFEDVDAWLKEQGLID